MTKTESLAALLPEKIDAALVSSEAARRYFTAFPASDGYLVVMRDRAVFFTDSRYTEAAEKVIRDIPVVLQKDFPKQLKALLNENNARNIGVENATMTLRESQKLAEAMPEIELVTDGILSDAISSLRMVKSREEIECIKTAQAIAEDAFEYILGKIEYGKTEKQLALELDFYMLSHGAEAVSFETIAVSGENSSLPHGVPGNRKIQKGDFITFDFGAVYNGYHSDMTRTIAVGQASDEMRTVYNVVLEAQRRALDSLCEGISGIDADKAARDVIDKAGYGDYFGHGTGHGVGIEIHEGPNLSPKSKNILKSGNVITVEPGIYLPGKFGVRIEDMAVITKNGCENLTNCPKELIIL